MKRHLIYILSLGIFCSCAGFLEPLPNGSYNEENHEDYPKLIRGYVEKAYDLRPDTYASTDYIGCDGLAGNMTWSSRSNDNYKLAIGSPSMSSYNFASIYERDYKAIYYCNLFLKDNIGRNTRYMLDPDANAKLQKALQGDAFALRAWYLYDLLKFFGGRSVDGQMLGVPIFTEPVDPKTADMSKIQRATYEECINQILEDCDSAFVNLPLGNRDFLKEPETVPVLGYEIVVRALGPRKLLRSEIHTLPRRPGSRYILCSDGVNHMIDDDVIADCIKRAQTPHEAVDLLMRTTLRKGGHDNITIIAAFEREK